MRLRALLALPVTALAVAIALSCGGRVALRDTEGDGQPPDAGTDSPACDGPCCSSCNGSCVDLQDDPTNCGSCNHSCQGGACQAGACQPTVLASVPATDLVIDATNAYFLGVNSVQEMPLAGGPVATLASEQYTAWGLAVGVGRVYWTNAGSSAEGNLGDVLSVSIDAGAPATLASGLVRPFGITVGSSGVYWVTQGSWTAVNGMGSVYRTTSDGGTATLASQLDTPWRVTVDAMNVYWTSNPGGGTVMRMPLQGGTPTTIASGPTGLWAIAVDATNVYWTDSGCPLDMDVCNGCPGRVMAAPIAGGQPHVIAAEQCNPVAIAVDTDGLYWANSGAGEAVFVGGAVMMVASGSSTPVTLAPAQNGANGIAADATNVYWTVENCTSASCDTLVGSVMKIAKP